MSFTLEVCGMVAFVHLAAVRTFLVLSQSLPRLATLCAFVDSIVTYNGGMNWHWGVKGVPLFTVSPTKLVALFEGGLSSTLWSRTLNAARVSVADAFGSAADSAIYYENAYDGAAVGSGTDLASATLLKAIDTQGADIIIAG